MTTPPIPPAMVKAGRDKLDETLGFGMLGHIEMAAKFATYPSQERIVAAILAAALGVCSEVREQYGAEIQLADGSGDLSAIWRASCGEAQAYLGEPATTGRLLRRFRFTSPAEQVDTEGAPA